jgi:hypothetical protein
MLPFQSLCCLSAQFPLIGQMTEEFYFLVQAHGIQQVGGGTGKPK